MLSLLAVFAFCAVPGLVIAVVASRRAPVGFEDGEGFHAFEQRPDVQPVLVASVVSYN